jgi:hypothetical protein
MRKNKTMSIKVNGKEVKNPVARALIAIASIVLVVAVLAVVFVIILPAVFFLIIPVVILVCIVALIGSVL